MFNAVHICPESAPDALRIPLCSGKCPVNHTGLIEAGGPGGMVNRQPSRAWARGLALATFTALTLSGCGGESTTARDGQSPSATPSASADAASTPNPQGTATGSALPEDWRPEEPAVLATGMQVPDDYEPATLEHPARNVPKPVMPAEAAEETEAGAQAFLNYRADAQWYAMQTGDTVPVRNATAPECRNCTEQFDEIEALYRNGGWAAGGWETVKIPEGSFEKRADGGYNLPVSVNSRGSLTFSNSKIGVKQEPYKGADILDIYIDFRDGKWTHVTASPRGSL